jgi:hypothetical protein
MTAPNWSSPDTAHDLLRLADSVRDAYYIASFQHGNQPLHCGSRFTQEHKDMIEMALREAAVRGVAQAQSSEPVSMTFPATEPIAYRWRAHGSENWIYDPTWAWIEDHRHEVEIEPLYTSPMSSTDPRPFYGAECPSYPNCSGGCGLGCTKKIEAAAVTSKDRGAQ